MWVVCRASGTEGTLGALKYGAYLQPSKNPVKDMLAETIPV